MDCTWAWHCSLDSVYGRWSMDETSEYGTSSVVHSLWMWHMARGHEIVCGHGCGCDLWTWSYSAVGDILFVMLEYFFLWSTRSDIWFLQRSLYCVKDRIVLMMDEMVFGTNGSQGELSLSKCLLVCCQSGSYQYLGNPS